MFGLNALGNAVRTLTGNVLALASTVAEVNQGIRGRLALDGDGDEVRPALPPAVEARAALPQPLPEPPAVPEGGPEPSGNGKAPRRKAKAE